MGADSKSKPLWLKIVISLLAMLGIILVLGWGAFIWMDSWTLHGKVEIVPNVKGMQYNQAVERLTEAGLTIELTDSLYDSGSRPGTVIEQNPKGNTKVKPGRVVYVTINAFSPKTETIPQLTDISMRQARSILEGLGFKNVEVKTVVSEFKDLVLGARCNGRPLMAGARVPINATIELEVGDGMPDLPDSVTIEAENTGDAAAVELLNLN